MQRLQALSTARPALSSTQWMRSPASAPRARKPAVGVRRNGGVRVHAAAASWWGPSKDEPAAAAPDPAQQAGSAKQQPLAAPSDTDAATEASNSVPKPKRRVHLPGSLYASFPKLPPDGSSLTAKELRCDPETEICQTRIHVWETKCSTCYGSGTHRSYSSSRQKRGRNNNSHRLVSVCMICSGLGYVRHTSAHAVPDISGDGPHTTIGRPPPSPAPKPHLYPFPPKQ